MKLKIYKGKLKELGDSVIAIGANNFGKSYSYVEFQDGQMITNLISISGLDGKLADELGADGDVELSVFDNGKQKILAAIKSSSGRLYATNGLKEDSIILKTTPLVVGVLGILLIPLFGVGFVLLYFSWKLYKQNSGMSNIRKYVQNLSGAVYI